jgi:hypothetical protein
VSHDALLGTAGSQQIDLDQHPLARLHETVHATEQPNGSINSGFHLLAFVRIAPDK